MLLRPVNSVEKAGEKDSSPLANAVISIRSSEGNEVKQAKTDEQGKFQIAVRPGIYQLVPLKPNPGSRYPKAAIQIVQADAGRATKVKIEYDSGVR